MTGFSPSTAMCFCDMLAFQPSDVHALVDLIEFSGAYVTSGPVDIILPDSTDLPFLKVAIAGSVDVLW